jgi:hypothetical protein
MKLRKITISFAIVIICILNVTGVDMDFGIFNYKGSRLKEIKRYGPTGQDIKYKYDERGYLVGRDLSKGFNKIYQSTINYDLEKNVITESFMLYAGNNFIGYTYLTYYYNDRNEFIKLLRKNENSKHENSEITQNMDIEYNEKGDITRINKNDGGPSQYIFFPDDGFAIDVDSIYKYEYENNKKTLYGFNKVKNIYYLKYEKFFNEKSLLTKIIEYYREKEVFSTNYFYYDANNNLTQTIFVDNLVQGKQSNKKIIYEYDKDNRLKKRIIYNPDTIARNKIDETEEYFYEDGNYVYYPYLLPPKIKMYLTQEYEMTIDKFVF